MSFTKVAPAGIGTEPGTSILIGDSLLHSTGIDIGSNTGIGVTIRKHGDATFTGIITAASFSGSGANLTGIDATAIKHTDGNVKVQATGTGANLTGNLSVSGNLGVGGVLTYEDVTNVDSVGVITARGGIKIGPTAGVAGTFFADGSYVTAGIITATSFSGSGANLTGISAGTALSGSTNNTVCTVTGANAIQGEANLTFDGNRLGINNPNFGNYSADCDDFIIQGSANTGITINSGGTGNSFTGNLAFAEGNGSGGSADATRGLISYKHNDDYMTFHTDVAERLRITSDGKIGIGDDSPDALLSIKGDSNEGSNPSIRLKDGTDTRECWITNNSGDLLLAAGGNDNAYHSRIRLMDGNQIHFDVGGGASVWKFTSDKSLNSGNLTLNGLNDSDDNYTQINSDNHANTLIGLNLRLRRTSGTNGTHEVEQVNSHGSIGAAGMYMGGNGSNNNSGIVFYAFGQGNSAGHNFGQNAWRMRIRPTSAGDVMEVRTTQNSGNAGMIIFRDGNLDFCGQITSNGSNNTTSYNTSSDYRLKINEALITDGITRVKNLKPYQFEWKSDLGTKVDGFFAHEAQTVVPESVVGTKDEVDSDGNPKYQGIDQAKLVPLLTASIKELIVKVETLETKVTALEGS